ncbi:ABC transporter permease [Xanthomonas campestris pv. phormiicola]|nr:ABC transporter permease [Xanthomonas campestris pv. phormiicola]UYC18486.1 ABC transporter permease [Xanthomonas campestris pv. phormiicola]
MLQSIWAYRYFIFTSIKNELKARFVRSKLGGVWMIIHPLMQVLIYAVILSEVLSAKLQGVTSKYGYALYLLAGMLFWTLFSETVGKCLTLFVDNGNLMRKIAFPRICLPIIAAGTALVNNLLLAVAIFCVFAVLGHFPGGQIIWLPVLMLLTLILAMGIGIFLGVLNVFMRDIGQVVPVVLNALFWLTPIVYNLNALPQQFQNWFGLNPLYGLVTSYQAILVYGTPPLWPVLGRLLIGALVVSVLAMLAFRRSSAEMVDAL